MKDEPEAKKPAVAEQRGIHRRARRAIRWGRIRLPVAGAFVLLCILAWLGEILDLPHFLLGAPSTRINWREAIMETIAIATVGFFAVLSLSRSVSKREQTEEALRCYAERLAVVNALGHDLSETLDLWNIYELLSQAVHRLMPDIANLFISLYDPQRELITCVYGIHGGEIRDVSNLPPIPLEAPGVGTQSEAIRTRRPLIINDLDARHRKVKTKIVIGTPGPITQSGLYVPMLSKDKVVGVVQVQSYTRGRFDQDDASLLALLANTAGIAIEKARLFDQFERSNEELRRHRDHLEELVGERTAELEAFAYSISHDLRAPLRAMHGFSQALLEDYADRLDPTGQDYARRIVAAAQRMDTLILDLLTYSHLGRAEMRLGPVRLGCVVEQALAALEADIEERGTQVAVEEPLPQVAADHATLVRVVGNLLSNAIRFVAPDVCPRVRVWAEERGERIRLWVEDNGIGIPPQYHERIFRVFERLHGIETYPGTGIGLAIVKKGVERMGGRVGLESEIGQGSRFWIELGKA